MSNSEKFMQQVEYLVCDTENVSTDTLYAYTNKPESVLPRQMIFYLVRLMYKGVITLEQIGKRYGKDHATVIHGCRKVQDYCDVDKSFNSRIQNHIAEIKAFSPHAPSSVDPCVEELHLIEV